VIDAGYTQAEILAAIKRPPERDAWPSNPIYGDGHAGPRIAEILATAEFNINKVITY
jgi:hypothetical protein